MELISSLESALAELRTHLELIGSSLAAGWPTVKRAFRTAAIESYECAYELSVRAIRRRLQHMSESAAEIAQMDFEPLMRVAAQKGLVEDPVAWFLYCEKRNETAHTYDETKALDVVSVLPEFLASADFLLKALHLADAPR